MIRNVLVAQQDLRARSKMASPGEHVREGSAINVFSRLHAKNPMNLFVSIKINMPMNVAIIPVIKIKIVLNIV